jgi:hypothetical protein
MYRDAESSACALGWHEAVPSEPQMEDPQQET